MYLSPTCFIVVLTTHFMLDTFGENLMPLNLNLADIITDKSDDRSIWRHHTAFIDSNITETIFTKSDLRYAEFRELDINNVDFTDANLSNAKFRYVNLNNVKPADNLPNGFIDAEWFDLFSKHRIKRNRPRHL